MKPKQFLVEFRYKLKVAPTTGTTLTIVLAADTIEAMLVVLANPNVKKVEHVWVLGKQEI